jgi:type III secretion protein T
VFQSTQSLKGLLAALMMLLFLFVLWDSLQQFLRPDNGVLEFLRSAMRSRHG